jgi:hypothetical protein
MVTLSVWQQLMNHLIIPTLTPFQIFYSYRIQCMYVCLSSQKMHIAEKMMKQYSMKNGWYFHAVLL